MARRIGGIGTSHSPTIGDAKDTGKQNDPAWKPIFDGFDANPQIYAAFRGEMLEQFWRPARFR